MITGASRIPLGTLQVLDVCANLVEVDQSQNIFRFVHLSVREFFESFDDDAESIFTSQRGHIALAQYGLSYICQTLAPRVSISTSLSQQSKNEDANLLSSKAVTRYVDRYWLEHAKLGGIRRRDEPFQSLMRIFLQDYAKGSSVYDIWSKAASFGDCADLERERCWAAVRNPVHPCWLACAFDLDEVLIACLNDKTFNIEMKTGVNLTPLLEAARLGSENVLLELLERGADLSARTPRYDKGVIDFASENGHTTIIKHVAARISIDTRFLEVAKLVPERRGPISEDPGVSSQPLLECEIESVEDDFAIQVPPTHHVDYLSHDWRPQDLWTTWRFIISKRTFYKNTARLESACWRVWAQSMNGLQRLNPEDLNW